MSFQSDNLLCKLLKVLQSIVPYTTYESILEKNLETENISQILTALNDKRIRYPSDLFRFVKRNRGKIQTLLATENIGRKFVKYDREGTKIFNILDDECFTLRDFFHVRSTESEAYKRICEQLNKKDTFKNRIKIYYYCKLYFKQNKSINDKEDVAVQDTCHANNEPVAISSEKFCQPNKVEDTDLITFVEENGNKEFADYETLPSTSDEITNIGPKSVVHSTPKRFEEDLLHTLELSPIEKQAYNECSSYDLSDNNQEILRLNNLENVEQDLIIPTPEKIVIPSIILNLSPAEKSILLPLGCKNVQELPMSSFKDCTYLEGTFEIEDRYIKIIITKNKLNTFYSSFFLRNRISKFINNTCNIILKYTKYMKNGTIKLFAVCQHKGCKSFRIVIENKLVSVYSSSINFSHKQRLTTYVKGVERALVKHNIMKKKPLLYKKETILNAKRAIVTSGNLQDIKSDSTLRKIRSESLAHLDRDENDIWDLIKMQQDHKEYIQEISIPFCVKLFSREQLYLLEKQNFGSLPVIYFDATGSVVRKPFENSKRVYLYSAVVLIKQTKRISPVFEMISSSHFSKTIFKIIHDFRVFCEDNNKWPIFGAVVTDFSFANIHAISMACNRIELLEYLNLTYQIALGEKQIPSTLITIHLCCAHFMKMVSKDVTDNYTDYDQAMFIKDLLAQCIRLSNLKSISEWFFNVFMLLNSPCYDKNVKIAYDNLIEKKPIESEEYKGDYMYNVINADGDDFTHFKAMYQSSPYYNHFKTLVSNISVTTEGKENPFYNKNFFNTILTKYMPYCSLWTAVMIKDCYETDRFSNCYAENYFNNLKTNILNSEKNLKASRFIRKCRANVLASYKEVELGIPKSCQTRQQNIVDPNDKKHSQEIWKKKDRKIGTHFSGRFLKETKVTLPEFDAIEKIKDEDDIFDIENCIYCGAGRLEDTAKWVQCDSCRGWVHQKCESLLNKSYSGIFICKLCLRSSPVEVKVPADTNEFLKDKCVTFIKELNEIDSTERKRIKIETATQRKCEEWNKERRKRITASNFGRICKARNHNSKLNIAKDIVQQKNISRIPAVKHGIDNEGAAIDAYIKKTKCDYQVSGLILHKSLPFLAASPDGLINEDGILEVKCPFKMKPDYLDSKGKLKMTHNYFYQVQGLLEITNRPWCDFAIYNHGDLLIQRIYRNKRFWKGIINKLKAFYYYYYLPTLLMPGNNFSEEDRKWTTVHSVEKLPNGLVSDPEYYKENPSGRDYNIAAFDNYNCHIKEINYSDLDSLTGKNWLTGFVVSIILNILNRYNHYQVVEEIISTKIFSESVYSNYFLENAKILGRKLAMPVIINKTHFCLALVDFDLSTFTFIDPMGSSKMKSQFYFKKFDNFIKQYNTFYNINNYDSSSLNVLCIDHILQNDGHNCGPLIIYFFENISQHKSLKEDCDLEKYRIKLKSLILQNSSDMTERCLLCSRNIIITDSVQCEFCRRFIHLKCLILNDHPFIKNRMCDICRLY